MLDGQRLDWHVCRRHLQESQCFIKDQPFERFLWQVVKLHGKSEWLLSDGLTY